MWIQICNSAINLLMGPSTRPINMTRAPVYLAHTPSETSTMSALHLAQVCFFLILKTTKIWRSQLVSNSSIWITILLRIFVGTERWDKLFDLNIHVFDQVTPPPYEFSNIHVPVYHIRGTADILATEEDVHNTESLLKKDIVKVRYIPSNQGSTSFQGSFRMEGYNHTDYSFATDCAEMVYNHSRRSRRSYANKNTICANDKREIKLLLQLEPDVCASQ